MSPFIVFLLYPRHLVWLPVKRRCNLIISNFDVGIKKLGGIDLNSEIHIWVITVEVNPSKFFDTKINIVNGKVKTSVYRKRNKMLVHCTSKVPTGYKKNV